MEIKLDAEKIIEQAANRLADEAYESVDALQMLRDEISCRIDKFLNASAQNIMDETLLREMDGIMSRQFQPVNQWGEGQGKPTSLRDEMQRLAAEFWSVKLDSKSKKSSYGGKPRHQYMFEELAKESFASEIQANIEPVIAGFREALLNDSSKMLVKHIDRFIKLPVGNRK